MTPIDHGPKGLHVSQSAARALTLLDTVATSGSMNLSEAASSTDMPASTALRHLRALVASGWLGQGDDGRYSSGPTLARIALQVFRTGPLARLISAAEPHLETIVERTQESAYLAVRDGTDAVYVATAESPRAIRHVGWVGQHVPIESTAVGESLTAAAEPPGSRPPIAVNIGALEPDVAAVTVPIFAPTGVAGAFSVLGPAERLDRTRRAAAGEVIAGASVALSEELAVVADPTRSRDATL